MTKKEEGLKVSQKNPIVKDIVIGAAIGGIAGAIITPNPIVTGTTLGIIIGGGIGAIVGLYTPMYEPNINNINSEKNSKQVVGNNDVNIKIREEQLDIAKKLIQTGEVTVHKEVLTEEKNIVVPVTREEFVIEKKVFDTKSRDKAGKHIESIRIPITEEHIEVIKNPVVLNNVSINKRQFKKTKRVEENLKKEKVHLEITGKPKIIEKDT